MDNLKKHKEIETRVLGTQETKKDLTFVTSEFWKNRKRKEGLRKC